MANQGLKLKDVRGQVRVAYGNCKFIYKLEWIEVVHTGDRFHPDRNRKIKKLQANNLEAAETESRKVITDRKAEVAKWNVPGGAAVDLESPMIVESKITVIEVVDSNKHALIS